MKTKHLPSHWVTVALVTAAAMLTITEAWGQASGAAAVFEGRPSMAGAQAGTGAMAGPPQGGIGLQGPEGSQLKLRPPPAIREANNMPQGTPAAVVDTSTEVREIQLESTAERDAKRDPGMARKQQSPSDKVQRSAKRTTEASKYGVSPIDSR
ncbi:hypothetical protein [uncultured Ramlibacter sp.]|uniref:hypothetical protein n=1 Tax=uncultured Ramlibacter sp. TaxID=260755 RepID=UPI002638E9DD|nr:hypothetical protein [uncultured Ramlibacter sp.]